MLLLPHRSLTNVRLRAGRALSNRSLTEVGVCRNTKFHLTPQSVYQGLPAPRPREPLTQHASFVTDFRLDMPLRTI